MLVLISEANLDLTFGKARVGVEMKPVLYKWLEMVPGLVLPLSLTGSLVFMCLLEPV